MHGAKFETAEAAKEFILAGNARVTLVSVKTGARFTYQVRNKELTKKLTGEGDGKSMSTAPHFVSLLRGQNNESDYAFLGSIFGKEVYRHGTRSRITPEAPSAVAFKW